MAGHTSQHASVELGNRTGGLLGFLRDFHNKTILFRLGDWIIVTYGMIAGLAFLVGVSTATWYMGMVGSDVTRVVAFYLFFAIPSILMVSRLTSILLEWRELFKRPLQTLLKPGYMLHGGIFGGMMAFVGYSFATGTSLLALLDAAGFCMPLGEAIARLGCYVYGCCWGRPTDSRFGVAYTSPHSKVVRFRPDLQGVKIHPAQLYALTAHLIQFTLFYALLPYKVFDGMFAALYLITHPIIRYALEFFRQDDRGKVGRWTHTNIYSLIMVALGVVVLGYGLVAGTTNLPVNLQFRYVHTLTHGPAMPYFAFVFLAACAAFGVHYKAVGSWVSKPSGGMKPDITEMGMGATERTK